MTGIIKSSAQGFQPPAEGKAVVYFTRVTSYGFAVNFEYFHNDQYIGVFKRSNYMRFELDPGEQLLWASSENRVFIEADLEEGGTYIIMVDVIMGAWKARVGLRPITVHDHEDFERAKRLVIEKSPIVVQQRHIEGRNRKLAKFIDKQLELYKERKQKGESFRKISPDMKIPVERLI